jgi:hypothetical protein
VNIEEVDEWREPPEITFEQIPSLQIAKWVLSIFAGVYLLCFVLAFGLLFSHGAEYDKGVELLKYMLGSILPLVTLAVGFYLGDRSALRA